jgi:hypothetical protein
MAPSILSSFRSVLQKLFMSESPPKHILSKPGSLNAWTFGHTLIGDFGHATPVIGSCYIPQAVHLKRSDDVMAHELVLIEIESPTVGNASKSTQSHNPALLPQYARAERTGSQDGNSSQVSINSCSSSSSPCCNDDSLGTRQMANDVLVIPKHGESYEECLKTLQENHYILRKVTFKTPVPLAKLMITMMVVSHTFPYYDPMSSQCYLYATVVFDLLASKFEGDVSETAHASLGYKNLAFGRKQAPLVSVTIVKTKAPDLETLSKQYDKAWEDLERQLVPNLQTVVEEQAKELEEKDKRLEESDKRREESDKRREESDKRREESVRMLEERLEEKDKELARLRKSAQGNDSAPGAAS